MKANKIPCHCGNCGKEYRKRADRVRSPDFCTLRCRMIHHGMQRITNRCRTCSYCGLFFLTRGYQLLKGGGQFCSQKCASNSNYDRYRAEARKAAPWRKTASRS